MKVLFLLSTFATIALGDIQTATVCGMCTPDGCMDDAYIEFGSNFGGHNQSACVTRMTTDNIGNSEEEYKTSEIGIAAKEAEEEADRVAIAIEQAKIEAAEAEAETDEYVKALKIAAYKLIQKRVVSKRKEKKAKKDGRDKIRGVLVDDNPDLKKERVKESRIKIAKTMLPFTADFKAKLKKDVAIAMSEEEAIYDDECLNGINCCTYDIANDDENTMTLLGLADSVGAWGVLCDGAELLSRQVRKTVHNTSTDSSEYTMSCWNGTEFSSEATRSTGGNYACRSRTIMVGSQGATYVCPLVPGGTCTTCSDKDTCTAVTCVNGKFNNDGIFNNGCEAAFEACDENTTDCDKLKACYDACPGTCGGKTAPCEVFGTIYNSICLCHGQ